MNKYRIIGIVVCAAAMGWAGHRLYQIGMNDVNYSGTRHQFKNQSGG